MSNVEIKAALKCLRMAQLATEEAESWLVDQAHADIQHASDMCREAQDSVKGAIDALEKFE